MAVCCVGLLATPAQATVNQSMQDWFNDIGAVWQRDRSECLPRADYEPLYRRQPVHAYPGSQLPARQHCAAVVHRRLRRDRPLRRIIFLHQQGAVRRLLRNIGNNAIGAAFNMALCSMSPDLCDC
jgi:hypothetical protein